MCKNKEIDMSNLSWAHKDYTCTEFGGSASSSGYKQPTFKREMSAMSRENREEAIASGEALPGRNQCLRG